MIFTAHVSAQDIVSKWPRFSSQAKIEVESILILDFIAPRAVAPTELERETWGCKTSRGKNCWVTYRSGSSPGMIFWWLFKTCLRDDKTTSKWFPNSTTQPLFQNLNHQIRPNDPQHTIIWPDVTFQRSHASISFSLCKSISMTCP